MTIPRLAPLAAMLLLLGGCAATIDQGGVEQRTAQAIGRTTDQFTITDRSEETGGRINYSVQTKDGAAYRCYMYSATGFQRAMTFGQTPHSDAICTAMVAGQGKGSPVKPATECNALLRAAGRC
jgi:hypothetical protein